MLFFPNDSMTYESSILPSTIISIELEIFMIITSMNSSMNSSIKSAHIMVKWYSFLVSSYVWSLFILDSSHRLLGLIEYGPLISFELAEIWVNSLSSKGSTNSWSTLQ